jgi:hypothetical protein
MERRKTKPAPRQGQDTRRRPGDRPDCAPAGMEENTQPRTAVNSHFRPPPRPPLIPPQPAPMLEAPYFSPCNTKRSGWFSRKRTPGGPGRAAGSPDRDDSACVGRGSTRPSTRHRPRMRATTRKKIRLSRRSSCPTARPRRSGTKRGDGFAMTAACITSSPSGRAAVSRPISAAASGHWRSPSSPCRQFRDCSTPASEASRSPWRSATLRCVCCAARGRPQARAGTVAATASRSPR